MVLSASLFNSTWNPSLNVLLKEELYTGKWNHKLEVLTRQYQEGAVK